MNACAKRELEYEPRQPHFLIVSINAAPNPGAAFSLCQPPEPAFSALSWPPYKVYLIFYLLIKEDALCCKPIKTTQTLLSPRIPATMSTSATTPSWKKKLKECLFCLQRNAMMFDLEVDSDLIEQRIYERQALLPLPVPAARARELGLHTVLKSHQPMGG